VVRCLSLTPGPGWQYPGALPTTDPDPLTSFNLLNPIFLHATFEHPSDEVVPACVLSLQALLICTEAECTPASGAWPAWHDQTLASCASLQVPEGHAPKVIHSFGRCMHAPVCSPPLIIVPVGVQPSVAMFR
jgi:hypothetical protein